jgi:hypothetical protein
MTRKEPMTILYNGVLRGIRKTLDALVYVYEKPIEKVLDDLREIRT